VGARCGESPGKRQHCPGAGACPAGGGIEQVKFKDQNIDLLAGAAALVGSS
jgi:hypothetical protein